MNKVNIYCLDMFLKYFLIFKIDMNNARGFNGTIDANPN